MRNLAILIPSYKREDALRVTLEGLYNTLGAEANVLVCVGLNEASPKSLDVVRGLLPKFSEKGIIFKWLEFPNNIGKAVCLNSLFDSFCGNFESVITMDNDMQLKKPWLHLLDVCDKIDYDLMGFASAMFWAHDPGKVSCKVSKLGEYTLYNPVGVAGGMLLFHRSFLAKHKWTNFGGVYGRDDQQMCSKTSKRYVLEWPEDWLQHDPLGSSTPELKKYHERKQYFFSRNVYVLQKGWDSESPK